MQGHFLVIKASIKIINNILIKLFCQWKVPNSIRSISNCYSTTVTFTKINVRFSRNIKSWMIDQIQFDQTMCFVSCYHSLKHHFILNMGYQWRIEGGIDVPCKACLSSPAYQWHAFCFMGNLVWVFHKGPSGGPGTQV